MSSHGTENGEWKDAGAFATLCSGVEPSMNCVEARKLSSMVGGGELGTSGNALMGIWSHTTYSKLRTAKWEIFCLSIFRLLTFTAMERMYTYDVAQRERRKMY